MHRRFHIGVAAGAHHRDEHIGRLHFASAAADHRNRPSGMIDEQLLTGPVVLPQHQIPCFQPIAVALAKPTVLIAFGIRLLVLFP